LPDSARAERVLALNPEWAAVVLADRSGVLAVDTRVVPGSPLPTVAEKESFVRVLLTERPAVGSLTRHCGKDWLFAVRAPVLRDGSVRYVLTALVKPDAIRDVLTRQQVPGDWVISIMDASGARVARSRAHEENLGGRLSDTVQRVVDGGGAEGFGLAYTLEGERIFTPYSRSRRAAERESLLSKERQAREAAETADRAKEQFMAVLSHELRTPLNAVYGWARMLQGGQLRDEALVARAKDAIVRNADVQVQLIDDLLDLSRITSGKMRLEVGTVDMPRMLTGALEAVRPAADAKMIRMHTELDPDASPVTGDPARLQQVVWNLLMNAVKFTPAGGQVQIRFQCLDSQAQLVVSDTGQGIAPEILPHVFERFRQADSSSTRTHGGLGLGLALVKHLVELHGGTVVAQSAGVGQGATFIVTLPIAPANAPAASVGRMPPSAPPLEALSGVVRLDGLRVLVADDDSDALALAEAILTGAADVRTCVSASGALDLLRQWRADVLVSDIEMPGEDEYSLIRKLRALAADEGGETPAVALTAYGRPQDRLRSLAGGFNMHVPKPVDPGELTAIIAGVASQPERPRFTAYSNGEQV
jgi:signal transduction histidine kinase/ActR/RegA family two-component response regulator